MDATAKLTAHVTGKSRAWVPVIRYGREAVWTGPVCPNRDSSSQWRPAARPIAEDVHKAARKSDADFAAYVSTVSGYTGVGARDLFEHLAAVKRWRTELLTTLDALGLR